MAPRGYGQYGGVARAVELIGERWALLIVRDLLVGPRRYTDLKAGLPRIPTNILSDRLRELQEAGVVHRVPIARCGLVYELTASGRALEDAVLALARWGLAELGDPVQGEHFTRDAFTVELRAAFRADAARGAPPTRYTVHLGAVRPDDPGAEEPGAPLVAVVASVVDGALDIVPIGEQALPQPLRTASAFDGPLPGVEFAAGPALRRLLSGELDPEAAVASGEVRVLAGDPALVARFARTFRVEPHGGADPAVGRAAG